MKKSEKIRKPSIAYLLFNFIIIWVSALLSWFSFFISLPIVGPIILLLLIYWIFF